MRRLFKEQRESAIYSLSGRVFEALSKDIIMGKIAPGTMLYATKLSSELGVSRTPIREAIRRLEAEGLVRINPNKGAEVLGVSPKDVDDIYNIRILIEGLAARVCAENIDEEGIKELKECLELMEFYTGKNDYENLIRLDLEFHQIIFKTTDSRPLIYLLTMCHHLIQRARESSYSTKGRPAKSLKEHQVIFQAIKDRELETAERLMAEHISNAIATINKKD